MNTLINGRGLRYQGMYVFELRPAHVRQPKHLFVCLHGFPAWRTKNYDIAEQLCLLGNIVLVPHYPGLGLSEGSFSFVQSVQAIEGLLRFAKKEYGLPISMLGHSWGGYVNLALHGYVDERMILLAPLAKFPVGKPLRQLIDGLLLEAPEDCKRYTRETMEKEFGRLAKRLSMKNFFHHMRDKRLLVIHGTRDDVLPIEHSNALVSESKGQAEMLILDEDHLLCNKRRQILRHISRWIA